MGLIELKRGATRDGICAEYKEKWDKCADKAQLMDVALSATGLDFLAATSASEEWGLSPEYIARTFANYINGRYVRDADGYTSEMYVLHEDPIVARCTATLLMRCNCEVEIPKGCARELYLSRASHVLLRCEGMCVVVMYGDDCTVTATGGGKVRTIKKGGWDR